MGSFCNGNGTTGAVVPKAVLVVSPPPAERLGGPDHGRDHETFFKIAKKSLYFMWTATIKR